jgi:hypothetical protein
MGLILILETTIVIFRIVGKQNDSIEMLCIYYIYDKIRIVFTC